MWGFYQYQVGIIAGFCFVALLLEKYTSNGKKSNPKGRQDDHLEDGSPAHSKSTSLAVLTRQYLAVYAIVMGADWLQGPYVFSLYREQYGFPERIVALLFVTGFVSAAVTAPLVGAWADQHGRRRLCMAFCVTYTITCCCIMVPFLPVLLVGRVLGGISTSILYSAFESWLISSSNNLALPQSALSLIMGRATLVNGFVASAAGIASNQLVSSSGSFVTPFMASALLLVFGWIVIRSSWGENYGGTNGEGGENGGIFQIKRLGQAWTIVHNDPLLLVLGLTQTCFEGSMYLFVFVWVPTLQEAAGSDSLPLGYVFSAFMLSMMLGSLLYSAVIAHPPSPSPDRPGDSPLTTHAKLSSLVCAISALTFAVSVRSQSEHVRFFAFCVFEACVGLYYPVQGMLRGTLIANEHRATLSALFRVPLNIFVVVSLLTGVEGARNAVLSTCSGVLGFSAVMTGLVIVKRASEMPYVSEVSRPA